MSEDSGSWLGPNASELARSVPLSEVPPGAVLRRPLTLAADARRVTWDEPDRVESEPVRILRSVDSPDPDVDHGGLVFGRVDYGLGDVAPGPVMDPRPQGPYQHLPGIIALMLANKATGVRAGVLAVMDQFEAEVARSLPEFAGRARSLRLDLEQALAGETPVPPHLWREFNDRGGSCHYPGCELPVDAHPAPAGRCICADMLPEGDPVRPCPEHGQQVDGSQVGE